MTDSSRNRATAKYRRRLSERGMARFEVLGRKTDRELIRTLARQLAEEGPQADHLRTIVTTETSNKAPRKGGILRALRSSPLVGPNISTNRPINAGREIDL